MALMIIQFLVAFDWAETEFSKQESHIGNVDTHLKVAMRH